MSDDTELSWKLYIAPAIQAYYVSNNTQQASTLKKKSSIAN